MAAIGSFANYKEIANMHRLEKLEKKSCFEF